MQGKKNDEQGLLPVSRRAVLAGGGTAALLSSAPLAAQAVRGGQKFRAYVVDGSTAGVRELSLLPVQPRGVVIRTEAASLCYTMVYEGLKGVQASNVGALNSGELYILGHSAVGVVEQVGSLVQRVRPGDRVMVSSIPHCGQCYHCLNGAAQFCAMLHQEPTPVATLDGRPVMTRGGIGGVSEITVVTEELCIPIWSDAPSEQLALLADTGAVGLAAGFWMAPIEPGSDVVVQGCGAVGLAAVQAARIKGAAQIIAVEPIARRRALATKLGATLTLDPNAEGGGLVKRIRELCKGPTDRALAGGRAWAAEKNFPKGADFTIEAAGADKFPSKLEPSPDPTGMLALKQAWEYTRSGGHVTYLSVGQAGNLQLDIPTWQFFNRGRTMHGGQMGGLQPMRDLPKLVRLMERGLFDAGSMIAQTYSLADTRTALQGIADRTIVGGVVKFS